MARCSAALWILTVGVLPAFAAQPNAVDHAKMAEHLQELTDYFASDPRKPDGGWHRPPTVDLSGLDRLPDGDPLRLKAIALARKYANPADLVAQPDDGPGYHHQAHSKLHFSWNVLLKTECLRPEMRFEEFVAIIGGPYRTKTVNNVTYADWYYLSTMHINPGLRITLEGNRVKTVKVVSY